MNAKIQQPWPRATELAHVETQLADIDAQLNAALIGRGESGDNDPTSDDLSEAPMTGQVA